MSQSRGRSLAGVLLIGVLAIASNACAAHADRQQPNIIYLMLDDAGYGDFGSFGSHYVKTPNFDRLCAEGMTFTNHYSGSAVCAPTRCVLMTGLHTGHCRRRDNTAKALTQELSNKNGRPLVFLEDSDVFHEYPTFQFISSNFTYSLHPEIGVIVIAAPPP